MNRRGNFNRNLDKMWYYFSCYIYSKIYMFNLLSNVKWIIYL